MKKVLILAALLSVLLFASCMNANTNQDETFDSILAELTGANTIKYNEAISETYHYAEAPEHAKDLVGKSVSKHMIGNAIIERSPLFTSAISIISNQEGSYFHKTSTGHSDKPFYREMYGIPIDASDYAIDTLGTIKLTQSFEDSVSLNMERHRQASEIGLHQEEDYIYWTMPFDVLLESASDPFNILFYLIKENFASFKLMDTDTGHIVYVGGIDPDTIASYYINDGSNAFEGLFYGYEGEMTREALMNEMIGKDYSAILEPMTALLFTEEHMPVTIAKDPANGTYAITIIMTEAQNALNEKRHADSDFSVVVDESITEYTNMVLE